MWLCPTLILNNPGMIHPAAAKESELFVDIGIYGTPQAESWDFVESHRKLEEYVRRVKG